MFKDEWLFTFDTMKAILIASLLFLSIAAEAQNAIQLPIDSTTGKVTFSEIVQVEGIAKDELYLRAKDWFVRYFNSANDVLQIDDAGTGRLVGKGMTRLSMSSSSYSLFYSVTILVKDGRYKCVISDFEVQSDPINGLVPSREALEKSIYTPDNKNKCSNTKNEYRQNVLTKSKELQSSIHTALSSKNAGTDSDF